jgi:hypothetical protein
MRGGPGHLPSATPATQRTNGAAAFACFTIVVRIFPRHELGRLELREHDDEPLSLQELGARVVGLEPTRHLLERLHRVEREALLHEAEDDLLDLFSALVVGHGRAVPSERLGAHAVHARRRERLFPDLHVEGGAHVERDLRVTERDEPSRVRLVGRLVGREAHVAVDAEDLRVTELEVRIEIVDGLTRLGEERPERLGPPLVVLGLVRGEPLAVLVLRERGEERALPVGEPFESIGRHRRSVQLAPWGTRPKCRRRARGYPAPESRRSRSRFPATCRNASRRCSSTAAQSGRVSSTTPIHPLGPTYGGRK